MVSDGAASRKLKPALRLRNAIRRQNVQINLELYGWFLFPTLVFFLVFKYAPMYGVQIAFKNYSVVEGFWSSEWVGLKHFLRFFRSYQFWTVIRNTVGISFYQLIVGFPFPIMLALLINQVKSKNLKKFVQTTLYAPHFISVVVLVGMLHVFLNPRNGLVNLVFMRMGLDQIYFMGRQGLFKTIYVFSGVWQHSGWGMIIYLAALSSIDPQLYEAAMMDGASRLQRIVHIDIPGILPTIVVLLVLNTGRIMTVGFEKVFLMQNPLVLETSEVIQTYVYKVGLLSAQFSFASAVGLFNGIVNLTLLLSVNAVAKRLSSFGLI